MSTEPELLDLGVVDELRESVGGDQEFVKELVAAYLAETPTYLEAIAGGGPCQRRRGDGQACAHAQIQQRRSRRDALVGGQQTARICRA